MSEGERRALIVVPIVVLLATGVAFAGGANSERVGSITLFALCILIAFAINWLVYLPSAAAQTEKYYDLTGSITYLTVISVALLGSKSADTRTYILFAIIAIWAVRLGSFLFARVNRDGHDGRFDEIKVSKLRFLVAWTLQALWVSLTLAAALAAMTSVDKQPFGAVGIIGLIVWVIGFAIEAISDRQKNQFRANPANKGKFITTGLWAWSRHPNYFGEIVLWVGVAIIAAPALQGWQWVTLISPIFVYLLLTRVSGVPLLENRADKRWGSQAAYQRYKANTPVLFPKPPSK